MYGINKKKRKEREEKGKQNRKLVSCDTDNDEQMDEWIYLSTYQ